MVAGARLGRVAYVISSADSADTATAQLASLDELDEEGVVAVVFVVVVLPESGDRLRAQASIHLESTWEDRRPLRRQILNAPAGETGSFERATVLLAGDQAICDEPLLEDPALASAEPRGRRPVREGKHTARPKHAPTLGKQPRLV